MSHQSYQIDDKPVFSLIAEEDNYEATHKRYTIRRAGLYPSEASVLYKEGDQVVVLGKCMRAAWYRASGVPKTSGPNVGLSMKGHLGKWDEVGTVNKWKEMGIWLDNNIKFYNKDLALSGELDAILRNPVTGGLFGLECKTFYGYYAGRLICGVKRERGSGKFLAGRPRPEHFLQTLLYFWEYRNQLDEFRLYYLERGDGHRIEFRVGFEELPDGRHQCYWEQIPGKYWNAFAAGKVLQPYTIEDIHDRYTQLLTSLRAKKLPPKDFEAEWDAKKIEFEYAQGNVSKTNYDKWEKKPETNKLGAWNCSYCQWQGQCTQDSLTY